MKVKMTQYIKYEIARNRAIFRTNLQEPHRTGVCRIEYGVKKCAYYHIHGTSYVDDLNDQAALFLSRDVIHANNNSLYSLHFFYSSSMS